MMIPTALAYDLAKQRERDLIAAANRPRRPSGSSSSHVDRSGPARWLARLLGFAQRPRAGSGHERFGREEFLS